MSQNTSPAVMAQRSEPHDSLDDFPTPPWATRALLELVVTIDDPMRRIVWEPACGRGHMARVLASPFAHLYASDVHPYGYGEVDDFLLPGTRRPGMPADWIISNPPFRLAKEFIQKARTVATTGVAMLVRSQFLEGQDRYRELYLPDPPTIVAQFVERVPMFRGRCVRFVVDKNGNKHSASTATAYTWLIWIGRVRHPQYRWIAPCRKRLERWGDYDDDQPRDSDHPAIEARA
jgi:hypothetical protein